MVSQAELKKELSLIKDELKGFIADIKNNINVKFSDLELQTSKAFELSEANAAKLDILTTKITTLEV